MPEKISDHAAEPEREEEVLEKTILNILVKLKNDLVGYEGIEDKHALLMEIKKYLEDIIQDEERLETIIVTRDKEIEEFENLLMEKDALEKLIEEEEQVLKYFHIGFAKVIKDLRMAFAQQDKKQRDAIIMVTINILDRLVAIGKKILTEESQIDHSV